MNPVYFLSIFSALGIVYLILGMFASKKVNTTDDYFLASRQLGLGALTFTLIATQIGGGMITGTANAAYNAGYYGFCYTFGMVIAFLMLGLGLAAKLRQFHVSTTAELFEVKYGSTALRKLASIISALSMTGILASQVVASRQVFASLGFGGGAILLTFWVIVIVYTMAGGLKAVVLTDIYQVIFLILVLAGIFIYCLSGEGGSFFSLSSFINRQSLFSGGAADSVTKLPIFVSAAMYPLFGQDLAQRFFAAKTKKIAVTSAIIAGIVLLLFSYIPVYFGMKAKLLGLTITNGNALVTVVGRLTNDFVLILVACGVIAAITSTADSMLCAVSSNIVQDFNFSFLNERSKLFFSKIVTLIAGCIGVLLAYTSTDILAALDQSYWLLISCLFVPVFFCFFTNKLKKKAAVYSIVFGFVGFLFSRLCTCCVIIQLGAVLLSFIGYWIGYVLDRD